MKKIKIAQIGTGHDHAGMMFETLRKMSDVFDVVGFAQVPEDNGAFQVNNYKGAREFTVDEILSMTDLDAIVVETFDLNLVKYAQKVADKGINI
jgi:predicted dehydrogenase